jgi:hypothetical protein
MFDAALAQVATALRDARDPWWVIGSAVTLHCRRAALPRRTGHRHRGCPQMKRRATRLG